MEKTYTFKRNIHKLYSALKKYAAFKGIIVTCIGSFIGLTYNFEKGGRGEEWIW